MAPGTEFAGSPLRGAERYAIVLIGSDLREGWRTHALSDTQWTLSADSLPAGLAHGDDIQVEVVVIRGADVITRSAP